MSVSGYKHDIKHSAAKTALGEGHRIIGVAVAFLSELKHESTCVRSLNDINGSSSCCSSVSKIPYATCRMLSFVDESAAHANGAKPHAMDSRTSIAPALSAWSVNGNIHAGSYPNATSSSAHVACSSSVDVSSDSGIPRDTGNLAAVAAARRASGGVPSRIDAAMSAADGSQYNNSSTSNTASPSFCFFIASEALIK